MRSVSQQPAFGAPLAVLAGAFATGVLAAQFLVFPLWLSALSVCTCGLAALVSLLRGRGVATLSVTIAFAFSGAALALHERQDISPNRIKRLINNGTITAEAPVEITGVLDRAPEVAPDRLYLHLRVETIKGHAAERSASGVVVLFAAVRDETSEDAFNGLDLRYGARIRVMTVLERADNFRNPGVSTFTEYLDRKGYDATGFVKSPQLVERLDNERVFLPLAWLYEWRGRLQGEIDSRFSKDTAGVLDAALLGSRHNLSHSTAERFREGGTFHVLVISGLHITVLGGLVFLLARRLTKSRLTQFLLATAVAWAYALAVGAEPSVVRAALMFTIVLLAPLVSRRASSLNSLGAVGIALLVFRPGDLLDPSFQLTFISVLAIVLLAWPVLQRMSDIGSWRPTRETPYPPSCAPWLRAGCDSIYWSARQGRQELEKANYSYKLFKSPFAEKLERLHIQRLLRYAFGAIVVSASVQLALLPFLVVYFHRLSLASLVLNIGVSLLMAGVAISAGAALIIAQLSATLASPLIVLTNLLNWLMVHSVDPFAAFGAASVRLPEYTGGASIIYGLYFIPIASLAALLARWRPLEVPKSLIAKKKATRFVVVATLFAIAVIVFHPFSSRGSEGRLRVDFLDVGQGDSALFTLPDGTTILVDGGGQAGAFRKSNEESGESSERESRSIGESVVSEYLWWRGLDKVDYLIATHADADHIEGLNAIARNFHVKAAFVARRSKKDPQYSTFAEGLNARNIPIRLIGTSDEIHIDDVRIDVLWPSPSISEEAESRNDDSIVLRFRYGEHSFLMTADIEAQAEKGILKTNQHLEAGVVKVGHHGSKTSSTQGFIDATRARFAVISVGQTSMFGHPNKDVVSRWEAAGARVMTTGKSGTITFTTDGRDLICETFVKPK